MANESTQNVVGAIPEFTQDETVTPIPLEGEQQDQVKETAGEPVVEEKETPGDPGAPQEPADPGSSGDGGDTSQTDINALIERATQGLRGEIVDLRQKLAVATGAKREVIEQQLVKAEQDLGDLKDVNPDDINLIERVLAAKGYVKKEDVQREFYERTKDTELEVFLNKYPELKPENDPGDKNWNALQTELKFYRMPDDPRLLGEVLERAYKAIRPAASEPSATIPAKQRQIEVASAGAGGNQGSSSSNKKLDSQQRQRLLDGGWSNEDITRIEQNL